MHGVGRRKFYEGRVKVFFESFDAGLLVQHFKDDMHHNSEPTNIIDSVAGKGVINNRISAFLMHNLELLGVKTHFIKSINMREQLVKKLDMIPIRVVIRNIAAGSIVTRIGIDEGELLPQPLIEFYHKKDKEIDQLLTEDHMLIFDWLNPWELDEIKRTTGRINDILSGIFIAFGIKLIDFGIEYGKEYIDSDDSARLIVGDEISLDTCRLWDVKTNEKFDRKIMSLFPKKAKEIYRKLTNRISILDSGI